MAKNYWIRERHNPQLGVYYVAHGVMSVKDAKKYEDSLYGYDYMLRFKTEDEYNAKIQELKDKGERFVR